MFFGFVALLYYFCILLLVALSAFVLCFCPPSPKRRTFCLLIAALLTWQLTLFMEVRTTHPQAHLFLGRMNFAAVVWAAYFCLRFVEAVAEMSRKYARHWLRWVTSLLFVLTVLTPLVCAAERVELGRAVTTYGPLFPVYLLHVLGCVVVAVASAFRERARTTDRSRRRRLTLIGAGIIVTSGISAVTNALLPFAYDDFRFCDVGALSVCFFALAVAYAVFVHRLFDARFLVRETLVYGILLAFVLGAYSSAAFVVTQHLTGEAGTDKLVQFVVLLIAFSFDPLRRFLEIKTDQLLFGEREASDKPGKSKKRGSERRRKGQAALLAILFPWRRG